MTNQVTKLEQPVSAPAVVTPSQILAKAYEQGASIEQLTQLLELQDKFYAQQERLDKRNAENEFNLALSEFKANAPKIIKDKHVSFGDTKYDHASLANVVYTITDGLSKYGLSSRWETNQDNGIVKVTCILSHKLGHEARVSLSSLPDSSGKKNSIQAIGSAVSYLQRYTLLAITGLATQEQDDDGKAAGLPEVKEPLSTDQAVEISDLLVEHEIDKDRFLGFFSAKVRYQLTSVEQLPADAYQAAKDLINKQSKKDKK